MFGSTFICFYPFFFYLRYTLWPPCSRCHRTEFYNRADFFIISWSSMIIPFEIHWIDMGISRPGWLLYSESGEKQASLFIFYSCFILLSLYFSVIEQVFPIFFFSYMPTILKLWSHGLHMSSFPPHKCSLFCYGYNECIHLTCSGLKSPNEYPPSNMIQDTKWNGCCSKSLLQG